MTTKNEVLLEGLVLGEPEWSHENHGAQFYRVYLQVPRLSGQVDLLPVLLPGRRRGGSSVSRASSAPSTTAAAWAAAWY